VAPAHENGAAQVEDNSDDMASLPSPCWHHVSESLPNPNNLKPNIQKYDDRSDPNIWLSTYYVAFKATGRNFDPWRLTSRW
jgi:hypothetical protein